ncbi:MAG: hypothetical protein ACE14L_17095 [Terriglobales bacterium]
MRHLYLIAILLLSPLAAAQQPQPNPDAPGNKPVPTVTFDLVFPGTKPAHYAISVDALGRAAYRSDNTAPGAAGQSEAGDPYLLRFTMSEATRDRIFKLTEKANYFKGDFDYTQRRIANTGTKTLIYSEGPEISFDKPTTGVRSSTVYNWSEDPAIQQLTDIFQAISNTLELGHRLEFLRRFDRLGLDADLKRAVELAKDNRMIELQAIAPVLEKVANDTGVLHIARQRAQQLLKMANSFPASGQTSQ